MLLSLTSEEHQVQTLAKLLDLPQMGQQLQAQSRDLILEADFDRTHEKPRSLGLQ